MKYLLLILCIVLASCERKKENRASAEPTTFGEQTSAGIVRDDKIREASGLVASINNPGLLWTHNDSGNAAELFLINDKGEITCTVHLPEAKNRDWEDITIGSGPESGKNYLYIGDIGDNAAVYSSKFLYRLEEPAIASGVADTTIQNTARIEFTLSDGTRDTEALGFDPLTNSFYIFSKRESNVNLYKLSTPLVTDKPMVAERVLEKLPFTQIVALDISKGGTEILAKNYDHVFYWKRKPGETLEAAVLAKPEELPYKNEPQGESIAFSRDGSGYYTISERKKDKDQRLFFYKRN